MCGRFQASSSPAELARWFKTTGLSPNVQQRYNAAPTQDLPIVLREPESGKRRLEALALRAHSVLGEGCQRSAFQRSNVKASESVQESATASDFSWHQVAIA
jgi:putative SOS response-associated peptidase YedK